MAYLVVGVVVIEAVFVYPGLGQLMVDAVSKRDVPVIQACGLVFALVFWTVRLHPAQDQQPLQWRQGPAGLQQGGSTI